MTNKELIKTSRNCVSVNTDAAYDMTVGSCTKCNYKMDEGCKWKLMLAVTDALEAADEEIADCVATIDALDDSNDAYIKENERLKKRIAELEAQIPEWTSVKDQLPEEPGEYVVYIQMGTSGEVPDWLGNGDLSYVTSMYFNKKQMLWFDEYDEPYNADLSLVDTMNDFHVTHWMPLPEAPKGEQG